MIPYASVTWGEEEKQNVLNVFERNWFSGGYWTEKFEHELASWWGVRYAIAVNSGSSANFIAMQALGLPENSEVITTPGGAFPTTISPIIYHKHKPLFVDINLNTLCIDENEVEQVADKADALIFAHTLGNTPNMDKLLKLKHKYHLKMIEDCCDSTGSMYENRKVGTFGDLSTVSFYPAHHMTTGGEGGAILTNNKVYYLRAKSIRDWGKECVCDYKTIGTVCENRFFDNFDHRYYYTNLGMNLKMSEFQAAFGVAQLYKLDDFIAKRKANYKLLCKLMGWQVNDQISPFAVPIYAKDKKELAEKLEAKNIQVRGLFAGNILKQPAYKHLSDKEFKNSDFVHEHYLFIGIHPQITEKQIRYIAEVLKNI